MTRGKWVALAVGVAVIALGAWLVHTFGPLPRKDAERVVKYASPMLDQLEEIAKWWPEDLAGRSSRDPETGAVRTEPNWCF